MLAEFSSSSRFLSDHAELTQWQFGRERRRGRRPYLAPDAHSNIPRAKPEARLAISEPELSPYTKNKEVVGRLQERPWRMAHERTAECVQVHDVIDR